jgi:outer membrane protein OmpA-like peptidoglycan-associated protein/polyisoprenoid-binding protein YceI
MTCSRLFRLTVFLAALAMPAMAQDNPLAPGWTLDPAASALRFQSIKNATKVEISGFATFAGSIGPDGAVTVRVALDSVDTGVDLRNVRMRFLFFETFKFPEAVVTATIPPEALADLAVVRRKTVPVVLLLDLHGAQRPLAADLTVTLLDDTRVAVAPASPISISIADFGLEGGIAKLEEAAGVDIVPSATVTFDVVFARSTDGTAPVAEEPAVAPGTAALEAAGDFSREACEGRFEILSRTGNIYFASGSARLTADSTPLLEAVADIVSRCPDLTVQIAGHTDADGGEAANQRLSAARAAAVAGWLAERGIRPDRFVSTGHGESRPVADNTTAEGKARNRRIEFAVASE